MNKLFYVGALSLLLLAACGETTEEKVNVSVNDSQANEVEQDDNKTNVETNETESEDKEEAQDINYVVADNDKYNATLKNIVKKSDSIFGNTIEVVFEVENKTDSTIAFQAREVSADGYMVDETLLIMSQEVSAGKKAKAVLTISDYEGYDFPELNEEFEMTLHVFNYDDFETIEDVKFKVDINK